MASLPLSLKKIALFLERLPGIGEKTANRLALFFLRLPDDDVKSFAQSLLTLKERTKLCRRCFNLTEAEFCDICLDQKRDKKKIIVLESVLDILSFEKANIYNGYYHILHGRIDPLNHVSADDLKINELLKRLKKEKEIEEVILATNPDMEGEATAIYLKDKIQSQNPKIKITRLAYGLPIGGNLEYADYMTLKKAIEGRQNF